MLAFIDNLLGDGLHLQVGQPFESIIKPNGQKIKQTIKHFESGLVSL